MLKARRVADDLHLLGRGACRRTGTGELRGEQGGTDRAGSARSRRELGSRSITANVLAPGFIKTDMTDQMTEARTAEISRNRAGQAVRHGRGSGGRRRLSWRPSRRDTSRGGTAGRRRRGHGHLRGRRWVCWTASESWSPVSSPRRRSPSPVARIAQEEGAQVVLTGFGRMSLVERGGEEAAGASAAGGAGRD